MKKNQILLLSRFHGVPGVPAVDPRARPGRERRERREPAALERREERVLRPAGGYDGARTVLLRCEGSGKLDRARSRLYRSQSLQVNTRWN